VSRTVDQALLAPHLEMLVSTNKVSLQNVVRALKAQLSPTTENSADLAREEYRQVLDQARQGHIGPQTWYESWYRALARARSYGVTDVEGFLATKDFLGAISVNIAPTWGTQQLTDLIAAHELGEPTRTLDQYGRIFESLL